MTNAEGKDKDKSETKSDYLSAQQDEAKEPTVHVGEHQQLVTSVAPLGTCRRVVQGTQEVGNVIFSQIPNSACSTQTSSSQ